MIAVGIDPSLSATGLASITDAGAVETQRVVHGATTGLSEMAERVRYIVGRTVRFVPRGSLVLIEEMYIPQGGKQAGLVLERAWLWGFLVDQMFRLGCEVVVVGAKQRAKLATGNGNAEKAEVAAAMRDRFPGVRIPDHNVADAVAMAAAGARWAGFPVDGALSKKQHEAMAAVAWPLREERSA
ncbi:crossover junction endodeoxyribonuclease RuvC [Herbiconiux sp.]|uniref:crossover junction endodeoxyribonuclease RuvC n=1 Tax=Herbiconiux sp. TaxID=1871186 RepID=UPI0025C324AD|nr:crossover junction endodeoxyribonuclease RuvC [Herbiconiux sp.]